MIVISQKDTYTIPVTANLPDDGGKLKQVKFHVQVKRLTTDEIDDLNKRIHAQNKLEQDDPERKVTDQMVAHEVVTGFGPDVQGDDGQPLPFNAENLDALLNIYPVRPRLVAAFFESLNNARAKN